MTEMEKKTTKPKKPRMTAAKAAEPKVVAAKVVEPKEATAAKRAAKPTVTQMKASREQIAELAHRFWLERGRQHGHDAEDWLRAEQQLLGKAS
jgi:hypothetical protein